MKNNDLLDSFINGATEGKASNLRIEGDKLIQYSTVIAFRQASHLFMINGEHYSPTTSRVQNYLKTQLEKGMNVFYIFDTEEDFSAIMNNHINSVRELEEI